MFNIDKAKDSEGLIKSLATVILRPTASLTLVIILAVVNRSGSGMGKRPGPLLSSVSRQVLRLPMAQVRTDSFLLALSLTMPTTVSYRSSPSPSRSFAVIWVRRCNRVVTIFEDLSQSSSFYRLYLHLTISQLMSRNLCPQIRQRLLAGSSSSSRTVVPNLSSVFDGIH